MICQVSFRIDRLYYQTCHLVLAWGPTDRSTKTASTNVKLSVRPTCIFMEAMADWIANKLGL